MALHWPSIAGLKSAHLRNSSRGRTEAAQRVGGANPRRSCPMDSGTLRYGKPQGHSSHFGKTCCSWAALSVHISNPKQPRLGGGRVVWGGRFAYPPHVMHKMQSSKINIG